MDPSELWDKVNKNSQRNNGSSNMNLTGGAQGVSTSFSGSGVSNQGMT